VSLILRQRLGEEIRLRERRAGSRNADAVSLLLLGERLRKDAEALIESDSVAEGFTRFDLADSALAVAEAADPNWAAPTVLRSEIAYRKSRLADDQREMFDWIDVGLGHANRALALDPNDPSALETHGTLQYWAYLIDKEPDPTEAQKLLDAAQADLERAVELDPGRASAFATLSHLYYQTDDGTTSVVLAATRAYREDAYLTSAALILDRLFLGHYDLQEFSQAQRWCTVGAERFPDDFRFRKCRLWLMTTPAGQPDVDEAWRIWSELVGRGFYEPVDDIGPDRDCAAPRTLDYLAERFTESRYDVKRLFRVIAATEAYGRQSRSRLDDQGAPFAAACPQRLRGDQLFNTLVQVLDIPEKPAPRDRANYRNVRSGPRGQVNKTFGYDPSILRDDLAGSIPQALFLMNSPELARAMSGRQRGTSLGRLLAEVPEDKDLVAELYLRCLAREPRQTELATCLDHVRTVDDRTEAFEDILWALVNSTEFLNRR
ncbi:MAG: DUF1553 domain-containing protein, partial [Planctomycetes bacterium]|nr:DUF1553 domain-containing protein [Planctomycetota bacterium]